MYRNLLLTVGLSLSALAAGTTPSVLFAQSWETTSIPPTFRFNDVYFATPDSGWAVSGTAQIYRTTDGGGSWSLHFYQEDSHLRSVGFLNGRRGFAGNVGFGEFGTSDPVPLYETYDGGVTWSPIDEFEGDPPAGLCGMNVVNDSTVVAVGRVRGPAFFVRTTDGGETWTSEDLSAYAAGLVDVYFSHPDTGFAVGLTNEDHELSSGIVLATTDGGESWEERFLTSRTGEWFWKMSWPTHRTGYVSLQRNSRSPIYIVKTTDAGTTWEEKLFFLEHYYVQGIGFINENTGWIGGTAFHPPYMTTDGGETWEPTEIGDRINRFRFLGDSLGFAAGETIHRYRGPPPTGIASPEVPALAVDPLHPNPFSHEAMLSYRLDAASAISIVVHDVLGRSVRTLTSGMRPPGSHEVTWDGRTDSGQSAAPGTYFVVVRIDASTRTQPVVYVR